MEGHGLSFIISRALSFRKENPHSFWYNYKQTTYKDDQMCIRDRSVERDPSTLLQEYVVQIDRFVSDRVLGKIDDFNVRSLVQSTGKKKFKPIQISDTGLECIEYLSLDCTSNDGE